MAQEIELKFLFNSDFPGAQELFLTPPSFIAQGYLMDTPQGVLRVRDEMAFLTYKSRTVGATRDEYEYPIPHADGRAMLATCQQVLHKTRRCVSLPCGRVAEIDCFRDIDLILVEIELESEDAALDIPGFCGEEVTTDPRYFNNALAATLPKTT